MKLKRIEKINYPGFQESFTVKNDNNEIVLNIKDRVEPHNGRELYVVDLLINGVDFTSKYFGNWNKIPVGLNRFKFSGFENKYCLIPAEKQYFLFNTHTLQTTSLPTGGHFFEGNLFDCGKHLLITRNQLYISDLRNGGTTSYKFSDEYSIEWAYFIDDSHLRLSHYFSNKHSVFDLNSKSIIETRLIIDDREFANTFRWIVWDYKKENGQNILQIEWVGPLETKQRQSFILEE
jgi:hypothetical protein